MLHAGKAQNGEMAGGSESPGTAEHLAGAELGMEALAWQGWAGDGRRSSAPLLSALTPCRPALAEAALKRSLA